MFRLVMVLLVLFAGSLSDDDLNQLARKGNIQEDAPVKASLEITIKAPPEKIWGLLTDVNGWPKWQKEISKAEITGSVQNGTEFSWTSGTDIHSRIALVEPFTEFAWTGKAYMAKAVHVWKLQRLANGSTLVKTTESMDGPMLTIFFSSKKLQESDQLWLDNLKAAAER